MIHVDVSSNLSRVKLEFTRLSTGLEEKATVRALNRAGDQSVTAASREIRKRYNIKNASVRSQVKIRNRASPGRLAFTVRIFSKRIPLIEFSASQTKRGVTVRVLRSGGRKRISHAFIATMRSGHRGVFVRSFGSDSEATQFRYGKGSRLRPAGQPDLPIAQLFAPSVPQMFLSKTVRAAVARVAEQSFVKNFRQQIAFLTRG